MPPPDTHDREREVGYLVICCRIKDEPTLAYALDVFDLILVMKHMRDAFYTVKDTGMYTMYEEKRNFYISLLADILERAPQPTS